MKTIYIGNIPLQSTESEVKLLFSQFGDIQDIKFIKNIQKGRPKVFCFMKMEDDSAEKAIKFMNQTKFGGRSLIVNEARNEK
jgi:RNA recognition motif-containing protein